MTHHAHPTPASNVDASAGSASPLRNAQGQFSGNAAITVIDALGAERDLSALPYHADDFRAFAKKERDNVDQLPAIKPDMTDEEQIDALARIQACKSAAHRYAAIWEALADARDVGRATPDRVTLRTRTYTAADGGTAQVEEIVYHGSRKVLGNIRR